MKKLLSLLLSLITVFICASCGVYVPPSPPPCSQGKSPHVYDSGKLYTEEGKAPYTEYTCTMCGSTYTTPIYSQDNGVSSFAECLPWYTELMSATVTSVRYETGYTGVAPGNLSDVIYSTDSLDITAALSILLATLVPVDGKIVPGAPYSEYTFITEEKSYDIRFNGGVFSHNGNNYVTAGTSPSAPKKPSITTHAFISPGDSFTVYNGDELIGNFVGLESLEFTEYTGPITLMIPTLYAETGFGGILRIYNSKIFSFSRKGEDTAAYYTITGDFDFSFLFE